MAIMYTKQQIEARVSMRQKEFGDLIISLQKPMTKPPGLLNNEGKLVVSLEDMQAFINEQKANAAQAAIRAFLQTAFEE